MQNIVAGLFIKRDGITGVVGPEIMSDGGTVYARVDFDDGEIILVEISELAWSGLYRTRSEAAEHGEIEYAR